MLEDDLSHYDVVIAGSGPLGYVTIFLSAVLNV